jgi:hypothetical protein
LPTMQGRFARSRIAICSQATSGQIALWWDPGRLQKRGKPDQNTIYNKVVGIATPGGASDSNVKTTIMQKGRYIVLNEIIMTNMLQKSTVYGILCKCYYRRESKAISKEALGKSSRRSSY